MPTALTIILSAHQLSSLRDGLTVLLATRDILGGNSAEDRAIFQSYYYYITMVQLPKVNPTSIAINYREKLRRKMKEVELPMGANE